jgi:hypothetical protein
MASPSVELFMSNRVQIEVALAQLEAGKFSFQMVDAIKDHISRIESELRTTRALHAEAEDALLRQRGALWRLEREVQRLNARIHDLVRAKFLVEKTERAARVAFARMGEHAGVVTKHALETAQGIAAGLKSGELRAPLAEAKGKALALQARIFDEKTLAEVEPYMRRATESLEAARKHAQLLLDRATAYLSTLHKTAA